MPSMRIPYTDPLPVFRIVPSTAASLSGAIAAVVKFLTAGSAEQRNTVFLTGAGISVASGLNDYRGPSGTYVLNKSYKPIYYGEFLTRHESRQRYWARSFIGWAATRHARPNKVHESVKQLGELGLVKTVITQNVDSFHSIHPNLPTIELHGHLRSAVCTACGTHVTRDEFQSLLLRLNPPWAALLEMLTTTSPEEQARQGIRPNPDGDIDLPGAPYSTFRYPPCPKCVTDPPEGYEPVKLDQDGAWVPSASLKTSGSDLEPRRTAGVLKPAVVMFGEAIPTNVRTAAENVTNHADRLLVLGSSLATYSAWKLARTVREDRGRPLGVINLGGIRGEENFFPNTIDYGDGGQGVRISLDAGEVLGGVLEALGQIKE